MASLKAVIDALRREMEAAFPPNASSHPLLEPRRLTLQLPLAITPSPDGADVSFQNGHAPLPSDMSCQLTLEIEVSREAQAPAAPLQLSLVAAPSPLSHSDPASDSLFALLSQALGAPGFDSSARAAVLHETLSELSLEDAQAALASLAGKLDSGTNETLLRAQRQLRRILEKGPAGLAKGAQAWQQVLSVHPREDVLREIRQSWKIDETWNP